MKIIENYRDKIKKLSEEYSSQNRINYNKKYLKKAIDLLQGEIYPTFPMDICFYIALLQNYLTDGLDFYWREPTYIGIYIDDIDYADDEQNITISDLKEFIKEINYLCYVCRIGDFEEDTLQTIDNLLNCIFDSCCLWIKKLFPKENVELFESNSLKKVQDIIDVYKFSGCKRDKENEEISNEYSLNVVSFFKNHKNSLKKHSNCYQYEELKKQLNLSVLEKYSPILDGILLGNTPILNKNDLHIENIWHFTQSNKNEWTYYIYSLEYLRTVVIQTISEAAISGTYELYFSRIEKNIIDEITNAIVFCMSNGKIRKYNYQDNIEREDFGNVKELDDENLIVTQYFCDNLLYLYNEFNKSEKFTDDEKRYMANCLKNICEFCYQL